MKFLILYKQYTRYPMEKLIEVKLIGMVLDPISRTPVMILKPESEKKIIPIWIGGNEANAITMELENISPPRPMTHDLIKDILLFLPFSQTLLRICALLERKYLDQ